MQMPSSYCAPELFGVSADVRGTGLSVGSGTAASLKTSSAPERTSRVTRVQHREEGFRAAGESFRQRQAHVSGHFGYALRAALHSRRRARLGRPWTWRAPAGIN